MHELAPLLAHIAPERIGTELWGFLTGNACGKITEEFSDILRQILPGCSPENCSDLLSRADDTWIRLAILCRNADAETLNRNLARLAFSKNIREAILLLHRYQNAPLNTHRDFCSVAAAFGNTCQNEAPGTEAYFRFRRALSPADASLAR